jgi:hypothetical protein
VVACLTLPPALANLLRMHPLMHRLRAGVRRQLLDPVLGRLDALGLRLDHIEHRLDELQALLEQVSARSSARSETSIRVAESEARTARRLEELERLLGAR